MEPLGLSDDNDEELGDPIDELIASFQGITSQARRKLHIIPHLATGELKSSVAQLSDLFDDAKDTLDRIQEEADRTPNAGRYMRTIRICEKDFNRLAEKFRILMESDNIARLQYLPDEEDEKVREGTRARRTNLVNESLVNSNTEGIDRARRTLGMTTAKGGMIMGDLKGQTGQLKHAAGGILGTAEILQESKRVLDGMARRAATNKFTTALIILLEMFIISAIIYFKWLRLDPYVK
jgi:hypothetical protein